MDISGNKHFGDLLEERARLYGEKEFLVYESHSGELIRMSYHEMNARANQVANGLRSAGVCFDDKVVVHLRNCPEFLATWFALAKLGAIMVPTNTHNVAADLSYIVGTVEARFIVTEPMFVGVVLDTVAILKTPISTVVARTNEPIPGVLLWNALVEGAPRTFDRLTFDNDHVAEIIFTSGTTASPKGAMQTHAQLIWSGEQTAAVFRIRPDERSLTPLPCFHVNAQSATVLSALSAGATVILLEQYSASKFWSQVRRHRANFLSFVPMMLRTLMLQPVDPDEQQHEVREIGYAYHHTGTEKEDFEKRYRVSLLNGYGLTEAFTVVASAPIYGERCYPAIGLPAWGRQIRLVDDKDQDVAVGQVGEIIVWGIPGRTILKGYFKNPAETARTIVDGWLHTGDNGYADANGNIYFFDRKKDIIKRAGENIAASEVERIVGSHPSVLEVAVIAVPDAMRDEAVKAFVVLRPQTELTATDLQAFCATQLARFKVPTIIEFRTDLPKTSVGKMHKQQLRLESMPASQRPALDKDRAAAAASSAQGMPR